MTKKSFDGHTISVAPGQPCGQRVVQRGPTEFLLAREGWVEQNEALMGFCELDRGHKGPCTHLMSNRRR